MPRMSFFELKDRRKVLAASVVFVCLLLVVLGVFAGNGWLPRIDPLSGKKIGWFGQELPDNIASIWNPFAGPMPSGTPQLSKEYIYAGSRLLAVEDANAGATPTPTPTPTPEPTPYGYESDVAPRQLGDGVVLSTDVTIVRRFVTGLDTPAQNPNEFQRADAAPRTTLGNGEINSGDVTQVQRYSAGLDPLTPAGGPTVPGNAPESEFQNATKKADSSAATENPATATNREVRVGPATGRRGQTVTIPVFMKMDREEMAVSFTLEYDAAKLSNPQLRLSDDLPASAVLTANITQAGRIGILIDAEERLSSTPRELRIVFVTFDVRNIAATGNAQIRVTSSLARQSVSDPRGILLATNYADGSVLITN